MIYYYTHLELGHVFCFGVGTGGALGIGTEDDVAIPIIIRSLLPDKIIQISAGDRHSVVISGKDIKKKTKNESQIVFFRSNANKKRKDVKSLDLLGLACKNKNKKQDKNPFFFRCIKNVEMESFFSPKF